MQILPSNWVARPALSRESRTTADTLKSHQDARNDSFRFGQRGENAELRRRRSDTASKFKWIKNAGEKINQSRARSIRCRSGLICRASGSSRRGRGGSVCQAAGERFFCFFLSLN